MGDYRANKMDWKDKEQVREYFRLKMREYNKLPEVKEKRKMQRAEKKEEYAAYRKKYNNSEKGIETRREYFIKNSEKRNRLARERYSKDPQKYKQSREYIRNYMKDYLEDEEKHEKYLIRQRDYRRLRKKFLEEMGCCQKCGSENTLELHHEDYSGDGEVSLLCVKCHRYLHRKKSNKEVIK